MNELTPKEVQILEVVYDAFGGACLSGSSLPSVMFPMTI